MTITPILPMSPILQDATTAREELIVLQQTGRPLPEGIPLLDWLMDDYFEDLCDIFCDDGDDEGWPDPQRSKTEVHLRHVVALRDQLELCETQFDEMCRLVPLKADHFREQHLPARDAILRKIKGHLLNVPGVEFAR